MELRELKTKDIFKMSKILKQLGVKVDASEEKTQKQLGAELVISVFENLHLAENEVSELLGDLVGISKQEFEELPLAESVKIFKQFRELPGIANFFKPANR